jgi:hypothetical protein
MSAAGVASLIGHNDVAFFDEWTVFLSFLAFADLACSHAVDAGLEL